MSESDLRTALKKIRFQYELPPLEQGGLAQLGALLRQEAKTDEPYRLLVIDHWLAASGERRGRDLVRGEYKEVAALRRLATEHKVAVVLVHHLRKMISTDAAEMVIGTTAVTAAVDSLWIIAPGDDDNTKKLEVRGRDIRERNLVIQFKLSGTERGWRVVEEGVEVKCGSAGREILLLLKRSGPKLPKEIAAALGKTQGTIRENLFRLHRNGRVVKEAGGRYAYPKQ